MGWKGAIKKGSQNFSDEEVCLVCKVRAPTCLKSNIGETNVSFNLYSSVLLLFPVVGFLETWSADDDDKCWLYYSSWSQLLVTLTLGDYHVTFTSFEKGWACDGWLGSLQVQQKWCCCVMGWSVMKHFILSMETGCCQCVSTKGQCQLALASWARKSYHLNQFLLPRRLRQF